MKPAGTITWLILLLEEKHYNTSGAVGFFRLQPHTSFMECDDMYGPVCVCVCVCVMSAGGGGWVLRVYSGKIHHSVFYFLL